MTWTVLEPMNGIGCKAPTTALNGYIHVVGNCSNSEIYDPKYDEWHQMAEFHGISIGLTLFTSDSFLYAFSGFSRRLNKYDLLSNNWTQVRNSLTAIACHIVLCLMVCSW